ncbi:MAG: GNAT family N-acetyltransferase [Candidatus Planktophila sp.]|jgi:ribosomal-protein-alanine N-acetyltransferase
MIWWPSEVPTLTYGTLTLRPSRESDIESIYLACQDPLISHFTTVPANYTLEHAQSFVRQLDPEGLQNKREIRFIIESSQGEKSALAGVISFHSPNFNNKVAEIGYWIAKESRGKSIGTTAVKVLTNFGFETMGWNRIEAMIDHDNEASKKVVTRAGYEHEGLLRQRVIRADGEVIDMDLYAVLQKNWQGLN